jgi:hypothetical protein
MGKSASATSKNSASKARKVVTPTQESGTVSEEVVEHDFVVSDADAIH